MGFQLNHGEGALRVLLGPCSTPRLSALLGRVQGRWLCARSFCFSLSPWCVTQERSKQMILLGEF